MLGELTERLALWASERRRWLFAFTMLLYAAGAVAFVRLPRPRDFAADLPAGHAVDVARRAQRAFPLLRLRVEPVDAGNAEAVSTAVAEAVRADPVWAGLSARAGAADGSARALQNARTVLTQLPPLAPLLALRPEASLSLALDTLTTLPDGARVNRLLNALADVFRRGKVATTDALPAAMHALLDWPAGAATQADDWRILEGGLEIWLRAQPGTPPDALARAAVPLVTRVRALGLRAQVDGYPLHLRSPAAPRWHGMLAAVPLAVAAGLAWAMGVSPAVAAGSVIAAGGLLAIPLLLLLAFGAGLDPAATWAFCAAGGLFGGLMLLYHGLRLGGRDSPDPLLRQVRRALRDSLLAAGLLAALCLLAAAGVWWAAPAAALSLAGTGLALPLYWGLMLPAVDLNRPAPAAEPPLLLRHSAWTSEPRFFAGIGALLLFLGVATAIEPAATPATPPPLRAGLPLALPTLADEAPTRLVRLRTLPAVGFAEGPPIRPEASERRVVEAAAQATLRSFPLDDRDGESPVETAEALATAAARLETVPALADAARRLKDALGPAGDEARMMRLYLASRSFRHGLNALRRDVRTLVARGLAEEAPSLFFLGQPGEVLLVVVPEGTASVPGLAHPLDTFATARESPPVGGMSWLTAALGLIGLAFVGLVAVGGRFFVLTIPALAASLPVLRAPAMLGVPASTLGTAAAWTAAIGATLFCVTVLRVRTGALAPRGLRLAVGACIAVGMLAGSFLVSDTPFGPDAAAALITAAVAMGITYTTA